MRRPWLEAVPWEKVVGVNEAFCQAQSITHQPNAGQFEAAKQLWERAIPLEMSLSDAVEFCRSCRESTPFVFNNGNTFASVGKTLVGDLLEALSPVEAQVVRTTIGHYIAGQIERRELQRVLRHFERAWRVAEPNPKAHTEPRPVAQEVRLPRPQVQI